MEMFSKLTWMIRLNRLLSSTVKQAIMSNPLHVRTIFELSMRGLLIVCVAATFKDEYFGVTGNQTGSKTSINFSRKLASSDPSGYNFLQSGISLLWAIASTDNINVQHDTSDVVNINFLTVSFAILNCSKLILSLKGETKSVTNYKIIHGVLMVLCMGFLAPLGTFSARYLKGIGKFYPIAIF